MAPLTPSQSLPGTGLHGLQPFGMFQGHYTGHFERLEPFNIVKVPATSQRRAAGMLCCCLPVACTRQASDGNSRRVPVHVSQQYRLSKS